MNQLYYRDLRKRIEALEEEFFPEPEPEVTICFYDEEDLPMEVIVLNGPHWTRNDNEPIPPAILQFAKPEARAAYEASASQKSPKSPPPKP